MDIVSAIIILACVVLDDLFISKLDYGLVAVSIDSFLAIIEIGSSLLIPYAENRSYQKYNLSADDISNIRGDTKIVSINLLMASIVIFVLDALFYMLNLVLTLFAVIVVCAIYICVFVVPLIVDYVKGDDAVIKMVRDKCSEYIVRTTEKFDSAEKLIVHFVLENGFEEAFNLLNNEKESSKDEAKSLSNNLFVFLVDEQTKYLSSLSTDPNIDDILTSKVSNEFMRNLFYLSSKKASDQIKKLDEKGQHKVFFQISSGLHILFTLIKDENLKNKFKNQTTLMLLDVIDSAIIQHGFDNTYLYFLTYLFEENLNNKNAWFIDAFADLCYRYEDIKKVYGRDYVLIMFFELVGYLCRGVYSTIDPDFEIYLKSLIKNKCMQLKADIERLWGVTSFSSLYETYIKIRDTLRKVFPSDLNVNNREIFSDTFFLWVKEYFLYTIPISYYDRIEQVDELIWALNDEQKTYLITLGDISNFGVQRYKWDLEEFVGTINDFAFLSFKIDFNGLFERITYIHDYEKRKNDIDNLRKKMGFDSLAQDFIAYEKDKPGYVEDLYEYVNNSDTKRANTYMPPRYFYINKNVTKNVVKSDESPINVNRYFNDLINHSLRAAADSSFVIDEYNEHFYKQIEDFNPKYKHAPAFDKYCKSSGVHLNNCTDIDLYPNWQGEVFFKENVLKYHIDFPHVNIRQISVEEAVNIFFAVKEENNKPSFIDDSMFFPINLIEKSKLEQIDSNEVSKILSTFYYVSLDSKLDKCVVADRSKALSFMLSSEDK